MNAAVGRFDTIIVGAGSAGCVLAYRLSERPGHRVLLLEAGPRDTSPWLAIPAGFARTMGNARLMWYYQTERDTHHPDAKSYTWLRGKVVGGSSAVNGMIYLHGHPADYDEWAEAGATGWGADAMAAAFRAMEADVSGGPLAVSIQELNAFGRMIVAAGVAAGIPEAADLNSAQPEGIGPTPCTIFRGRRTSAASAFLKPARGRRNLTVMADAAVRRLVMDGRRVTGVECTDGRVWEAGEVILSAGAIHSPMLLMRAGIGPGESLRAAGVPVLHDLPGVGRNLREHKMFTLQAQLNRPLSRNRDYSGLRLAGHALRYVFTRGGILARTFDVNVLARSRPEEPRPDLQITISAQATDMTAPSLRFHPWHGLTAFGYPMRPDSTGEISLRSPDPADVPRIVTNYLAAETDQRRTIALARLMRRIMASGPLGTVVEAEYYPGPQVASDEEILAAAHRDQSAAHAVGTCRIGTDGMAVVDPSLRVRGIDGLRVMDCSVMPTQVSGNTNGPVMAMAWHGAGKIIAGG